MTSSQLSLDAQNQVGTRWAAAVVSAPPDPRLDIMQMLFTRWHLARRPGGGEAEIGLCCR